MVDTGLKDISLADIVIGKFNPRKTFDPESLKELSESIKEVGLIEPLVVRPALGISGKGKKYEVVVGERRFRASKMLKESREIPCLVRELSDDEVRKLQLTENLLREDLNALEEAQAMKNLQDEVGMKEKEIAELIGKSQPWVSDRIRLLRLPKKLHNHITRGILGPSHAKAFLKIKTKAGQLEVAKGLKQYSGVFSPTVKQTENAVERYQKRREKEIEFQNVMKTAKVKKCPTCRKKAVGISDRSTPKKKVLTCSDWSGHHWNPKTGNLVRSHWEIQEEKRKKQSIKDAAKNRKKSLAGETHVPTQPAWFFSLATKEEWAQALLDYAAEGIKSMRYGESLDWRHYWGQQPDFQIMTSKTLLDSEFVIAPVNLSDYRTKVTIGSYRSTPSKPDDIVRGKAEVKYVREMIGKLLRFQSKNIGVKQTAKTAMPTQNNGFKLGAKVKVTKDHPMKSYRGAGAEIVGFTEDGRAALNYSKADKLIPTKNLEVVESLATTT